LGRGGGGEGGKGGRILRPRGLLLTTCDLNNSVEKITALFHQQNEQDVQRISGHRGFTVMYGNLHSLETAAITDRKGKTPKTTCQPEGTIVAPTQ